VNIEGVKTKVDFEVIEIMDESDPYPALLGIDWDFDNNVVLNLKKHQMSFETDTLHVWSCHLIHMKVTTTMICR
jgi:hypothetical protein